MTLPPHPCAVTLLTSPKCGARQNVHARIICCNESAVVIHVGAGIILQPAHVFGDKCMRMGGGGEDKIWLLQSAQE